MELLFDLCHEVRTQAVCDMLRVVVDISLGLQSLTVGPQHMLDIVLDGFSRAVATSSSLFILTSSRSSNSTPSTTSGYIYLYISIYNRDCFHDLDQRDRTLLLFSNHEGLFLLFWGGYTRPSLSSSRRFSAPQIPTNP